MQVVQQYIQGLTNQGLYPDQYICHEKEGNMVEMEDEATGKRFQALTFCTNDILGLTQDPTVKQAAIDAIVKYGTSNSSCHALSGRIDIHRQLEQEISAFKHLGHTHLFLNAWMAMQALIDGFCHLAMPIPGFRHTRQTLILTDILNHGCIVSAVANANNRSGKMFSYSPDVRVKPYRHCDSEDLARKLRRYVKPGDRILVVSDAVFSMDGDIAPLPEMIEVLSQYPDSVLVMDEAHASGSIGPHGGGIYDHFGITTQSVIDKGINPIIMTTFSKFAASAGAAISSHIPELSQLLNVCPTSIGTISLPAPTAAAALQSIKIVRNSNQLVQKLQANNHYLRTRLGEAGFEVLGETNVLPVMLPADVNPKEFATHLLEKHGIWVSPIWFIAKPRLRMTVNAIHTQAEMDRLIDAMIATRELLFEPKAAMATA